MSSRVLVLLATLLTCICLECHVVLAQDTQCTVELVVLGTAQDAGAPQIGNNNDPAWQDPAKKRLASSLAIIDYELEQRYLFEATPDVREQLYRLDKHITFDKPKPGLNGVFLTHAHIGHYAGLMFFGHESMGAKELAVYVMPRMAEFLSNNGPWDQMVRYDNISLNPLTDQKTNRLSKHLSVTPYLVPHRDEYSETVGFVIDTPKQSVLFVPDIDSWDEWEQEFGIRVEDMIDQVDWAFVDATFYDNNEIPGRDMSSFPHPRIAHMLKRFEHLKPKQKEKIQFIHLNHTNPARFPDSDQSKRINALGFQVASDGDNACLM
ncbi:MAG: MBL fold metallo-hydrolase [Pseudomonadota bacterium]